MKAIQVKTQSRIQFVDVTRQVREAILTSEVREGIALVYVPHTTAAVTINEAADPSVVSDIIYKLTQLVPHRDNYRHSEGNSDSHIMTSMIGSSVNLIISDGEPMLGTWQGIFFCEFDGPRHRKFFVRVIPG